MNLGISLPRFSVIRLFFLNLFAAIVGTSILQRPFIRYVHFSPPYKTAMLRADLLIALVSFPLGFAVYRRWRPEVSKWLWLAGLCWYVPRALFVLDRDHGSVLDGLGGGSPPNLQDVIEWVEFTDPCLRTIFYSTGAFCCSRLLERAKTAPKRRADPPPTDVVMEDGARGGGPEAAGSPTAEH